MHHFKTVPHVMIENGGSHKLAALLDQDALPHKVFVVTDNGLQKLGLLDPALASLHEASIETMVFDRVLADPPQEIVLAGAEQARRFGADMILGFGGGSPMDTAKVISALVGSKQPIETMYGVGLVKGPRLPLMLIPTTAGTGSEVTNVAILTTGKTEKQGIVSDALYADRVLLDAGLTLGLPKSITVATGIDAMVHAIEAYTSLPQKNPLS
ncbi:MAG TPA: iron-containing alcohol dehydrogenase, partial [Hellea balneolensis]|nr:iron-containing alcohol dehydrogenase [Hellea balneolensis]